MTIRFLKPWNGYQPDAVVSGLTNEAALIAGGLASDDLDGGNDGRTYEAKLATDASGNVTGLVVPGGRVWSTALVGQSNGVGDSEAIQAALDNTGVVSLSANEIYIVDSRLICKSDTKIIMNGATLKAKNALNTNILVNEAYLASPTSVTISATNGTATISWDSHGKSVGDPIALSGATEKVFNGVFIVRSVFDANTLTVIIPDRHTGSATGSPVAKSADKNISVVGGTIDFNGANQAGTNLNTMAVIFGGVYRPHLDDMRGTNGKKYIFLLSNCAATEIGSLNFESGSDGLHFHAPVIGANIESVSGKCNDNMLAITCSDYASYVTTDGDVRGVKIGQIYANGGQEPFRALGMTNCTIYDISIGKITGWNDVASSGVFRITDDSPLVNTRIKSLVIGEIDFYSVADSVYITSLGSGLLDYLEIGKFVRRNPSAHGININNADVGIINIGSLIDKTQSTNSSYYTLTISGSACDVESLNIGNFRWTAGSGTMNGIVVQHSGGTVNQINIGRVFADGDSTGRTITRSGAGTVNKITVAAAHGSVNRLYGESTGVSDNAALEFSNVSGTWGGYLCALASTSQVALNNVRGTYTTAVVNAGGTSKTPTIYGNNMMTTSTHIAWGSNVGRAVGLTLRTDVSKLTSAVQGDVVLDSAASNDPKRYTGAAWAAI